MRNVMQYKTFTNEASSLGRFFILIIIMKFTAIQGPWTGQNQSFSETLRFLRFWRFSALLIS